MKKKEELMRHLLGSIDLSDIEQKEETEEERIAYCSAVFADLRTGLPCRRSDTASDPIVDSRWSDSAHTHCHTPAALSCID